MANNGKKVLIVEDDVFVSDIYETKLKMEGYLVDVAADGREALKKLAAGKPDLMLLDLVMPYVDGFEVLDKMKNSEELKDIPVILLTNLSQKDSIDKGLELGANDYIVKSHFTPSEVMEKVRRLIR